MAPYSKAVISFSPFPGHLRSNFEQLWWLKREEQPVYGNFVVTLNQLGLELDVRFPSIVGRKGVVIVCCWNDDIIFILCMFSVFQILVFIVLKIFQLQMPRQNLQVNNKRQDDGCALPVELKWSSWWARRPDLKMYRPLWLLESFWIWGRVNFPRWSWVAWKQVDWRGNWRGKWEMSDWVRLRGRSEFDCNFVGLIDSC